MKRKARIQTGIDDRLVAIYARKSRITNKGDSIGVQFKQSADYAINQLSLPEDYEFARYEDKGLSGYYSDRPDFQRLLRDIEMGKIKAVACYKLDRISRKTSDLMRLLEYFERHDVTLLVCSNNINTRISTSKIIIQVLAIIAEFERDILTERIQDNLMELAKDGRWLGGKTPTGFSSQRVTTGSGKNKSAISFLVPVQEEKEIVLEIYGTFWETRSLLQTANIINEKYETKHGAKFTTSTIRLILRNPIYCVADEYSYNYFLEHDGNLFGEPSDFDGQHGLTAYNKTDQMKVEDEDSTFFNPKFSQLLTRKPISEWIVSVGRHEGFISSREWVETQNMLDEIAEKYNRPHRKTNALLSGLMYCPICGKRLRVLPESNRWTNGKPRFKYACPGVRAKECTFKGVEGVTLDEFVIHSLSSLQEEHSDYYRQLLENRVAGMIRTDQSEKEYQETKKTIERLNADIAAQVRNLREADDALKRFIQDDIKELTDELAKREATLRRMEDTQSENQYLIHELNGMKKRLLSFEEFAKDAQPEALFTLVHSIVDRIYITTDGTKQKCQVYIKGCATEDYSDVLGAAGYIEEEPLLPVVSYMLPMCDLDYYSIGTIRLIVISHWWNQFERLDLKSLGIRVVEGSNANTVAVAEWVLTAALMGIRRLTDFDAKMKEGSLWCEPRRCVGMLYGKRVGLVGLGRIGRYSARLFQMMGAKVQAYDKYFSPDEARLLGIELVTLDEALQNSDIISLHLPVTEETRGMLKKEHFEKIPDGAVFINSARAALYEEKALIEELKKKRFFAYLDVFSQEPLPVDHPLRSLENVLITPHIAGDNPDMFRLCGKQAIDTLRDYFSGKEVVDKKYYLGIGEKN